MMVELFTFRGHRFLTRAMQPRSMAAPMWLLEVNPACCVNSASTRDYMFTAETYCLSSQNGPQVSWNRSNRSNNCGPLSTEWASRQSRPVRHQRVLIQSRILKE